MIRTEGRKTVLRFAEAYWLPGLPVHHLTTVSLEWHLLRDNPTGSISGYLIALRPLAPLLSSLSPYGLTTWHSLDDTRFDLFLMFSF